MYLDSRFFKKVPFLKNFYRIYIPIPDAFLLPFILLTTTKAIAASANAPTPTAISTGDDATF